MNVAQAATPALEPAERPRSASAELGPRREHAERATLLEEHLKLQPTLGVLEPYWGAASATLCAAGATAAGLDDSRDSRNARPVVMGILSGCAAVSLASYALPVDYRSDVVAAAFFGAVGGSGIAYVHFSDYATPANRVTGFAFSSSFIAFGGLRLLDAALLRPVSARTLERDTDALEAWGSNLSEADLGRIEGHFRRANRRPVPRWAYGATQALAGVVAMSPAWVDTTSQDDRELAYLAGGVLLGQAATSLVFAAWGRSPYDQYVSALEKVKLAPIGPDGSLGLSLSGSF